MEWVLDSFTAGGRDSLLEIILRDRRTSSEEQAEDALSAILSLPFNRPMKRHYS
jgi:alpha-galactosidase/6-phospho-beta-glucosidase family protein